jgi:Sulfotransferase family
MPHNFVTIVSGLPRSGTSLMMQMLAAGGLQVLTDGRRLPDQHNPRGYFELEAVKHTRTDHSWLAQAEGKVVKVVHLLLSHLPDGRDYRVIFMQRDLLEVIASQRAMLQEQGRPSAPLADSKLAEVFGKQLAEVRQWCSQHPNFRVLYLQHRDVIEKPLTAAQQIATFLDGDLDPRRMAAAVEPNLYRQRRRQPQ